MNKQQIERLLSVVTMILSLLVTIFSILSILDIRNLLIRTFLQFFLGVMVMLNGFREIAYGNRKALGYSSIIISVFLFCVMAFTIYLLISRSAL